MAEDDGRRDIHVRVTPEQYRALLELTGCDNFQAGAGALADWKLSQSEVSHEVEQCIKAVQEHARELDEQGRRRKRRDE